MKLALALVAVLTGRGSLMYEPSITTIGWFGPSSYEECILDKLKDHMMGNYQVALVRKRLSQSISAASAPASSASSASSTSST